MEHEEPDKYEPLAQLQIGLAVPPAQVQPAPHGAHAPPCGKDPAAHERQTASLVAVQGLTKLEHEVQKPQSCASELLEYM